MSDATLHAAGRNPDDFAVQIADQIESFLVAVTEVAKGDEPDSAIPFLLLEVSQLLLAGGRLGAHEDFVPDERWEPDLGPEQDADALRENLARLDGPLSHQVRADRLHLGEQFPDGETIRWMAPADREDYFAVAVTGVQQLQAIGLNVELVSMDWGSVVNQRTQPEAYEIFNTGFSFTPEPTTLSFIPDDWPGWWVSEDKTRVLSAVMEETDPDKRKQLWDDFQALFYEEVPVIKVGDFFGLSIKRKELKGENIGISSFPAFWNQWLET